MTEPSQPELPVARVAVDIPLSHLDRPFDYAVTAEQETDATPGARVRVRFAGRLRDGFILERVASGDHEGPLAPLSKIVSSEPVLTTEIAKLIRRVADHYAGTFADVMRLAVPPRHAATELAERTSAGHALPAEHPVGPLAEYPAGPGFLAAVRAGRRPRAMWQVTPSAAPSGDWALGLATAARACAESDRGAVIIVPDQTDLDRLCEACTQVLGATGFAVLVAEAGPAARYRAFLSALRGEVHVVIGNRAAAYAPVHDLGLVALWDDGDDLLAEQRAPYPHAREVLALRADSAQAGALFASYARTAELQAWLQHDWLRELAHDRVVVRHTAPRVKVTADSDLALERDPAARAARVPHEVFDMMRASLPQGPVLVQVPRGGYLAALVCQGCREPARCRFCGGPTRVPASAVREATAGVSCAWCGRPQIDWECPICGSRRVRAPIVGAERTAEELGKAFPLTPVRQSLGGKRILTVTDTSGIVVATPGAEPQAVGGYAGAVLLDTPLLLLRQDLRAAEEALRRWLNVVALVRSGADGGSVIAVGESSGRALQALVRTDPAGFAARELAERAAAHFPPSATLITIEGPREALDEFSSLLQPSQHTELLGPVEPDQQRDANDSGSGTANHRLTLRAPLSEGAELVRATKQTAAIRSARKSSGSLRIKVNPADLA
ncbi:MAG TPA: primosomal protein N' [Propionibacteriaceae bacterium]|nr:primosomal protein N' [Propionibacteriaceae bacterium]